MIVVQNKRPQLEFSPAVVFQHTVECLERSGVVVAEVETDFLPIPCGGTSLLPIMVDEPAKMQILIKFRGLRDFGIGRGNNEAGNGELQFFGEVLA